VPNPTDGDLGNLRLCHHAVVAVAAGARVARRQIVVTVAVTAGLWLLFSSSWPMLPFRLVVTLVHEAGHALAIQLLGGDVAYVIVNEHGGGLTSGRWDGDPSTTTRVLVSSAGYVGTAIVGALMLEASTRLRNGRFAALVLAALVAAIGLAWVPLRVEPDRFAAATTGSSSGDGRFTIAVCAVAVAVLVALAFQPSARLRTVAVVALATAFCLASIDDLRQVLDLSSRGGHSDAANAAAATGLSSWMWAALWLLLGGLACGLGLWSALGGRRRDGTGESDDAGEGAIGPLRLP
jgi:hypothetical protein